MKGKINIIWFLIPKGTDYIPESRAIDDRDNFLKRVYVDLGSGKKSDAGEFEFDGRKYTFVWDIENECNLNL